MKKIIQYILISVVVTAFCIQGCENRLEEEVFSQLAPENFLNNEKGLEAVLAAAYSEGAINDWDGKSVLNLEEWCSDIEWETAGGENQTAVLMINFTWDANLVWASNGMWAQQYRAIRNANVIIDNIENADINEIEKTKLTAEARFIRGVAYTYLYNWFGPVPLRTSTTDPIKLPRATDEEMLSFIEAELTAVIPGLPEPGNAVFGRANKGAARGHLCKFYLNTKQWQKCADMAQEIMDMNYYMLWNNYETLFRVENDGNREMIWVHPAIVGNAPGNLYINGAFPPKFAIDPVTGSVHTSSMANWAAQYRIRDSFFNTFEESDTRKNLILDEYIDSDGQVVSLLGNDDVRSFKYVPDPDALGNSHGNDIPEIRYADILLSRAEALNEINGPSQEALDLINAVRNRATLDDLILSNFPSKEALRDHILMERGWEFYSERKRRQDLIRHGKFISSAQARGITNAQDYHVRFAIPQPEIDANPDLVQNTGY